jgi:plasmid stability protein
MAQLVVRNLEENVKRRLKQRAAKNGRSLEGEVREILSASVKAEQKKKDEPEKKGLGTRLAEIFAGTEPPDFVNRAFREEPVRMTDFGDDHS